MRTELTCKLFHPNFEQITRKLWLDEKWVEYPDICYRCEPDLYLETTLDMEIRYRKQLKKDNKIAEEYYLKMTEKNESTEV